MDDALTYREMIVQSKSAKRMIKKVSPIYEDSYVGCWLFEDIGREWDRLWDILDEMPYQLFPQTVTWLIDLWEQRYNVTPNPGDDIETRRRRLLEAEARPAPFTPFALDRWVYALCGRHATVEEDVGPSTFRVKIEENPDAQPMDWSRIREYIKTHKQSHMSFELLAEAESTITIKTETMYWKFVRPLAGTLPYRNYPGGVGKSKIDIASKGTGYNFDYPMTGKETTGTVPVNAVEAAVRRADVDVGSDGTGHVFTYPMTGRETTGTYPINTTEAAIERPQLTAAGDTTVYHHRHAMCGTQNTGGGSL